MTAEVAVLNKFGVALAADSAVTVDHFHHDKIQTKIYNSANKLFSLSRYAPVGVMFYNTITLGGIPYETLIKSYRRNLHRTTYDTIEEYADHFLAWLKDNPLFTDSHVEDIINTNMIRRFWPLSEQKSKKLFKHALENEVGKLKKEEFVPGFDEDFAKVAVATYKKAIDEAANCIKRGYLAGNKKKLYEYAGLLLTKKVPLPGYSGIVIAGFGEKEALPRLREYTVDIVVCGRIRCWLENKYEVDERIPSVVVPLADAGAIKSLTEGVSEGVLDIVFKSMVKLLLAMPAKILEPIRELTAAQKHQYATDAKAVLEQQNKEFWRNIGQHRQENYTGPMKQAISALPISELGLIAETFLGISQIQKRVTAEQETVGGPVDVAVISKGDGFIWIKRKFYFDDKLNPSFRLKYMEQ